MEINFNKDEKLRPFELINIKIIQERRLIQSHEEKRKVLEERIRKRMKLCREEDQAILQDKAIVLDVKTVILIQRQVVELDNELC